MNFVIFYMVVSLIPALSLIASKIWDKVKYLSLLTILPAIYLIYLSIVRNYSVLLIWLWSAPGSPLWQRLLVPLLLPEVQASVAAFIISIYGLKDPKLLPLATIIMLPASFGWVAEVNGVKILSLSSVSGGGFQSLGSTLKSPWLIWEFLALIMATLGLIAPMRGMRKALALAPLVLFTLSIYNLYARGTTIETTSRDFSIYLAFLAFLFQNPYVMPFVSATLEGLTRLNLNIGEYTWPFRGVNTLYFLTWSALGLLALIKFRKRDPLYLLGLSFYIFLIVKSALSLVGITHTIDAKPFFVASLIILAIEAYKEVKKLTVIPIISLIHPITSLIGSLTPLIKRNYKATLYFLIIASTLYGTSLSMITPYGTSKEIFKPIIKSEILQEKYHGKLSAIIIKGYVKATNTYNITYVRGVTYERGVTTFTLWVNPVIKGLEVCSLRIIGKVIHEYCYPLGTLFIIIPLLSYVLWKRK